MAAATIALMAAVAVLACAIALAFALWRDPYRLVRAEYARQRRALGLRRHRRSIDGCTWTWVEGAAAHADAPTVVMLHGYTGSKENWYRLAARLRDRYRLVIPDLPGWGDSQRNEGDDYGYAAETARVAAFIRAVSERPVVLLGHSMGGGIAAAAAARHPELIERVVLLNASGVEFGENRFGLEVLDGGNPFGVSDAASLERYLSLLFHDRSARPPIPWPAAHAVIAHRRREGAFEQSVLDRIGRGEARFLPGEEAARIRQPALLVWGAQDRVIDPSALDLFAQRIPHARKLLLEGSGHMTLMERPDAVAAAVTALIEEARPA
ncbi:alpha/beta fold hydrolase [Luteimonas sp. R10]|uniref:alpha/beta fold hydrolase n=1 Tax=Luteimonas sp. R10 TaxID=3108176 RepID=UPI0030857F77|nr:alpha/beta hydrolase [Luteimonas sp. R10]